MSPGPLRRLMGMLGLLALAPTALMLALDQIAPLDAALRGTATLLACMIIGRAAGWWVDLIARGLEQPGSGPDASGDALRRRRDDVSERVAAAR